MRENKRMLDFILGKEIAVYVKQHSRLVIISMLLAAVSSLFLVVPAALIQPFIDEGMKLSTDPVCWKIPWIVFDSLFSWHRTERVLVENISPNRLLFILSVIIFLSVLGKSIAIYLSELCATAFSNRAVLSLRVDLFNKYLALPLEFHHKRKSGELVGRATSDVGTLQAKVAHILIGLIKYPLSTVVFFVYLLFINYKLTLIIIIVGPIILGIIRLFGRKLKKHSVKVQDATADVTATFQESLICLKVIQGFCRENFETAKFKEQVANLYKRVMKWNRWDLGTSPALDTTVFLILPLVLISGKVYYDHTLGELASMGYAFSRLYDPIKKLAKVYNSIRTLQGATKRVFSIMDTEPTIKDVEEAKNLPPNKESIEFKHVNFAYSSDEPILNNVSFKVKAGEMVAFVGQTGAGKSTIMDLIPRFYDITSGRITIDGTNIQEVNLNSLRRQIGIVNQETLLFHESIAYNIGYGQVGNSIKEIEAAAKVANAHNFIMDQPNGYQTVIGDQGTLLSGGQRQRIAIARAIISDPAILILDEAASALDAESEKLVQEAIDDLKGSRTILVVAHRLSTILKADYIHVLEAGEIVESGTLSELLSLNGRFRQLYDMQFRNEER